MNYPVWDLPWLGSGLVVALIATFHVMISHTAIGGGAFLFGAELWSLREGDRARPLRDWLYKFSTWFLVTTTVLGAMTGVGIWFAIQLANPEATSLLIHQFVFVWATEWVVFVAELTILYYYYYAWNRNTPRMSAFLAGAYFFVSWLSLFLINGILGFMLTPDGWNLQNMDIAAGFFNPTFWPMLFIRTLIMFMLGGVFAIFVATRLKNNPELKESIVHFAIKWIIPAGLLIPAFGLWYWFSVPESTAKIVAGGMVGVSGARLEVITRYLLLGGVSLSLILLAVTVIGIKARIVNTVSAVCLIVLVQLTVAGGEFFREMARKPFVVYGALYSNSLWKHNADDPAFRQKSLFETARWMPQIAPLSPEHGEWVYRIQCANCHTRDGYRSLQTRTRIWTPEFGFKWLPTMPTTGVMPPWVGDDADRAAIVSYLSSLNGVKVDPQTVLEKGRLAEQPPVPAQTPAPAQPSPAPTGGK